MQIATRITYLRIVFVTICGLLLFLAIFQSIWVAFGTPSAIMKQIGLQQTRVEALTKDALILRDEPQALHAQALGEMQNILPLLQQTQTGLLIGDASLGLPKHPQANIEVLVAQSQSDYSSILNAAKAILAQQNEPIDPLETEILLDHEHGYLLTMSVISVTWQQYLDDVFYQLYGIETSFVLAIFVAHVISLLMQRSLIKKLQMSSLPISSPCSSKPQESSTASEGL